MESDFKNVVCCGVLKVPLRLIEEEKENNKKSTTVEERKSKKEDVPLTADEEQKEILAEEKHEMIQGVEDLSLTIVKEVMVPRIDVDFLNVETPEEELLEKVTESGHSRIPVYSGSIDNVVGILYVKDLIKALAKKQPVDLDKIIRKPYFVPESKHIDSLLREFKRRHVHIAIAIDEYGGISGIVCMEDIIEEIVGDIQDEFDNEREDILNIGLFRPIFSPTDFIQIKGRGTRTFTFSYKTRINGEWEEQSYPKTNFKLFDFFGNCEYFEEKYSALYDL